MTFKQSISNTLFIVLFSATVAFVMLFAYGQLKLQDKLVFGFVQNSEEKASLLMQTVEFWLKTDHSDNHDGLLDIASVMGVSGVAIFSPNGTLAFRDAVKSTRPAESDLLDKAVLQGTYIDQFDREASRFSRFSPVFNDQSCRACHQPAEKVIGIIRADFPMQDQFMLLEWLENLLLGQGAIMVLVLCGLVASVIMLRSGNRITRQLDEARNSLQMILDFSKAIIITTDNEGRVVEFNREAELLTGYDKSAMAGRRLLRLVTQGKQRRELATALNKTVEQHQKQWEIRNSEVEFTTASGEIMYVSATFSPLIQDHMQIGMVIICKDITEHLGLQMKLVQAEKLAGLGVLASGVAHEINNPLAGILGLAEAIQVESNANVSSGYVEKIIQYALNASRIVKDLTAYTRRSTPNDISRIDLASAIQESLRMAAHSAPLTTISIKRRLNEGCFIMGNSGEILQVFINLIVNAIHAMGDSGTLTLRCWSKSGRAYASISDTGIGIPKHLLQRIHDPFFTTKPSGKGTGLGLYVVYKIVTKHHGEFDCISMEGSGTTMTVNFPCAEDPARSNTQ